MRLLLLLLCLAWPACGQDVPALITAARTQLGVTVGYDPTYVRLDFPGGDVPRTAGVCTDVLIRALRDGWGIDLQLAVNRDMKRAFAAYPAHWGLTTTDRSIDHRRVPNLQTLFARLGADLPHDDFQPGDIVTWMLPGNLTHIGLLTDQMAGDHPMVLHNIGGGVAEEDILHLFAITGHYRLQGAAFELLTTLAKP